MNKDFFFCHNKRHLINKNNTHIMVKNSRFQITQVEEKNKHYTKCDIKRDDYAKWFQNSTGKQVKWILCAVDNNILQNLHILQEDVGIAKEIYRPSMPHFQGKTVRHKVEHIEPIMIPNLPKGINDRKKKVTLWCDIMHINIIGFLKTHILTHYVFHRKYY